MEQLSKFQSTPVITDGRTIAAGEGGGFYHQFQSTPVITDGRTLLANGFNLQPRSFNPRPSSLTGEPCGVPDMTIDQLVSIHARHH